MKNKYIEIITKIKTAGIEANLGEVYIALPSEFKPEHKYPLLIALHGSGREALSYRDIPFYSKQRDLALESGYIFASVSNGSNTFGTDAGYDNFINLYKYMKSKYCLYNSIVLFSSSAGGLLMHRIYRSLPHKINLLLGVFPLFDPTIMLPIKSLLNAYNARDEEELILKIQHLKACMYPKDIYKNAHIVISHGVDDKLVPLSQSEALLKQVNKHGGVMSLFKAAGGHSIENFAIYETDLFTNALLDEKKVMIVETS